MTARHLELSTYELRLIVRRSYVAAPPRQILCHEWTQSDTALGVFLYRRFRMTLLSETLPVSGLVDSKAVRASYLVIYTTSPSTAYLHGCICFSLPKPRRLFMLIGEGGSRRSLHQIDRLAASRQHTQLDFVTSLVSVGGCRLRLCSYDPTTR